MIAGFEDATSGRVVLDGEDMVVLPPNKRPMSMVFQSYALFPHLSVRDNVSYGLKLRRLGADEIRDRVDVVLASMNLTALADRSPLSNAHIFQERICSRVAGIAEDAEDGAMGVFVPKPFFDWYNVGVELRRL